jgi:hypothetical protein
MKRAIRTLCVLLAALLGASSSDLFASHFMGATISYQQVAPNTYIVNYSVYRDCATITLPSTVSLNLKSAGCNTGRTATLTAVGALRSGNPYCAILGNACSQTGRFNHEEKDYTGTVTFSAAEQSCPTWTLSITQPGRSDMANLVNSTSTDLYTEAYLNLAAGNSSAVFNAAAPAIELVCYNKDISLNFRAADADCDSLSYELAPVLTTGGLSVSYSPVPGSGGLIVNPNPLPPYNTVTNPQFAVVQVSSSNFTPNWPMLSYTLNWNQTTPPNTIPDKIVTAKPYFKLNPVTGQLQFKPATFVPNSAYGNNYAVVMQVNEWRKVNGTMVKVGHIRRDMVFKVEDCGSNELPSLVFTRTGGILDSTGIINIVAGNQLNLQIVTADQPNDVLTLESDVNTVLSGVTFTQGAGNQPTGTISWTASGPSCAIKYFYVRVKDNYCPVVGKRTLVFGVRVLAPLGTKKDLESALQFVAYPNPFSEQITFKFDLKQVSSESQIIIYNTLGQLVDRISLKNKTAGEQQVVWENGAKMAKGQYIAKLVKENQVSQTIQFTKL